MDGLDQAFLARADRGRRKALGQFLTPRPIAALMAEWIAGHDPKSVLDPAVGTGILLQEMARVRPSVALRGYDVDDACLAVARRRLTADLQQKSFLSEPLGQLDAVIANPPYIRHHDLAFDTGLHARLSATIGARLSKLANAYTLFLIASLAALKPGGVAAFLLPAEFANANFAEPVKRWMLHSGLLKRVIYYDPSKRAFDDNLSTGCVLLFRNDGQGGDVEMCFADPDAAHDTWAAVTAAPSSILTRQSRDALATSKKWNHLVQSGDARALPGMVALREIATTKRGIATGANSFFLLSRHAATDAGVQDVTVGCVGKSKDVSGYVFGRDDFEALQASGAPTRLVVLKETVTAAHHAFVAAGEARGVDRMYLTSKRKPWFSMERQQIAPIWAAVFGRGAMRFVANDAGVHNLTAFHCVYPFIERPNLVHALVACLNSRIVQSAAREHQRAYGGGLQKFEPRDLLDIPVPDLRRVPQRRLDALAAALAGLARDAGLEALDDLVMQAAAEAQSPRPVRHAG